MFTRYKPLTTNNELVEFKLNSPPWQPGLHVQRWISIPEGKQISFRDDGEWDFPTGTIVVQHFTLNGGANDGDPFETQIMWFNRPRTVRAGAYRWSADGSSANLIEDGEFAALPGQENRNWFTPAAEQNLNLD